MSTPHSVCGQLSGSLSTTQKQTASRATKESLCCPSKCIVAFKHCLLIKTQQKRITRCSACSESRRTTPIKAPIHMKAISRQRQLFRSSPPCQPPFAPQQECGRVVVCMCVCVISLSATGEASLLLLPATAPPECRLLFQRQGAHPALPACMSARLTSPHRWHCCPASCWASEKPLWQLSWLARLPQHPGCQSPTLWIDHISTHLSLVQQHRMVRCMQHCAAFGAKLYPYFHETAIITYCKQGWN